MKAFDKKYFDKWYRSARHRVRTRAEARRHAALAVATTEYLLARPIRRVLDIGAGEGEWEKAIRALRPRVFYVGIEPSAYAVGRFGTRRNIRHGTFGTLDALDDLETFDLVVCVDVLHYVARNEIVDGAAALGKRMNGVALLHAFTRRDDIEGDTAGYMKRPASMYRRIFTKAGLRELGLGFWCGAELVDAASSLEMPAISRKP